MQTSLSYLLLEYFYIAQLFWIYGQAHIETFERLTALLIDGNYHTREPPRHAREDDRVPDRSGNSSGNFRHERPIALALDRYGYAGIRARFHQECLIRLSRRGEKCDARSRVEYFIDRAYERRTTSRNECALDDALCFPCVDNECVIG